MIGVVAALAYLGAAAAAGRETYRFAIGYETKAGGKPDWWAVYIVTALAVLLAPAMLAFFLTIKILED